MIDINTLINNIKTHKRTLLLLPVMSVFLFATIITAAPTPVMGNPKTLQAAMGDLYPKAIQVAESVPPDEANITPSPTNPVAPIKKVGKKPSRSLTPPPSSTGTSKASAIIATGKQYIGVKYVFGGTTPSGFDCSGFTQYVFAKHGISLPRVSRDQYKLGTSVAFSNLQPGDLVFFSLGKNGSMDHMGIYVGNGQFINASSSKGVTIYSFGSYWKSAYVGAKHVL